MLQKYEDAAQMVADDRLTDEQIAEACGITRQTLARHKKDPEFQQRVAEVVAAYAAVTLNRGIARRERRVEALNARWDKMAQVIDERSTDAEMRYVPGGPTGLMVRQRKVIGTGRDAQTIEEFAVDTGLLKELRAHEKQAAEELGQWTEKHVHTGPDGGPVTFMLQPGDGHSSTEAD